MRGGNFFVAVLLFFIAFGSAILVKSQDLPAAEAALAKTISVKNYKEAAVQAYNIGESYRSAKKPEKAVDFFSQSLTYSKKLTDVAAQYKLLIHAGAQRTQP